MESIIEFADIGDFFDQPVKRYSSGMYSRLAFSVAIAIEPDVLVMDEVLAVGDEAFTRKCFARIEAIKEAGATIFFASHSPNLIVELCDWALLMDRGECLLQADPKTVIGQHHRLLYADPDREDEIRLEIRALGREPDSRMHSRERPATSKALSIDYGRFDPGLVSESTTEYGRGDAEISDVRIVDPDGNVVNLLRVGVTYRYCYRVRFKRDIQFVRFGMMIKLLTGFELAGQASHPPGEGVDRVEANQELEVEFSFVSRLIPGAYFMNAGVLAIIDGEEVYLHRIVDVLMFKVLPAGSTTVTGVSDLAGAAPPTVRID